MNEGSHNLATTNKWIADIPLKNILTDLDDVELNLVSFSVPAIEMSSSEISYLGDAVEVPTGVINQGDKTITFNYLISSNWGQYKNLWRWASTLATVNKTMTPTTRDPLTTASTYAKYSLPIRVYLIKEFKDVEISIKYSNCWIKSFGELSLDYSDESTPINHSFTVAYSDFEIE